MIELAAIESPWFDDFPALKTQVHQKTLRYLDTAATAHTPSFVIERMTQYYQQDYASVHRGAYYLSNKATQDMEHTRHQVARFLNAESDRNVIFTKGTTEAINLVSNSYLRSMLSEGDEIIVTEMEHHANLVPWQLLSDICGAVIKVWPLSQDQTLDLNDLKKLTTKNTRLIAVCHVSNVLGTVNRIKDITRFGRRRKIPVLVDGAQAVLHQKVDVQDLGCDFYAFSGHKLYGPTGIGVLYVAPSRLEQMVPWEGGGAMIDQVTLPMGTSYGQAPWRFEAGTPNIAGILGMGAAIQYLESIGFEQISDHEERMMAYLMEQLETVPDIEIYGCRQGRKSVVAFNLKGVHSFDVGAFLDQYGIAIRTGHHCAMPLIKRLGQNSVCRASIGLYTQSSDIDALVQGLKRIHQLLR